MLELLFSYLKTDFYHIKLRLKMGTNTKAKVLSLWVVLFYGKMLNLKLVKCQEMPKLLLIGSIIKGSFR